MDPKFRSSFIPKTANYEDERAEGGSSILSAFAVLAFILVLLSSGGLFVYNRVLRDDISNLASQLASAEASIDRKSINEILSFERRLQAIKSILGGHVAISQYFEMLEETVVSDVQFTNLKYNALDLGKVTVEMSGKARSFASIALQEDVLKKNAHTVSAMFNDLSDKGDGSVSFSLKAEFKPDLIKFKLPATQ